ncbi:hypothetical protein MLD38_003719 [Melastoma candidum]|uniref:Uncharacterized protein n=1 Tax=Melastoma candidum TaxID=119954 RepID=A0ACB9S3L4_9MYRT|nr:hypothetical protein MLD38_003719 [Melastoma candidum]
MEFYINTQLPLHCSLSILSHITNLSPSPSLFPFLHQIPSFMEYKLAKTPPATSPTTSPPGFSPDHDDPNNYSPPTILTPCAACKILRRRCVDKCVLAPYFPPTDPFKFAIAHRVFGASNIIKFLQDLPEWHRADAVSSMVYEANARMRDPVYGCAGAICQLQKQVTELQEQLARAQAELVQHANYLALVPLSSQFHALPDEGDFCQRFEVDEGGMFRDGYSLSSAEWRKSDWSMTA